MKVEIVKGGLLIAPETEFEEKSLKIMCPHGDDLKAFLKCGVTPAEVLGIKVVIPEKTE